MIQTIDSVVLDGSTPKLVRQVPQTISLAEGEYAEISTAPVGEDGTVYPLADFTSYLAARLDPDEDPLFTRSCSISEGTITGILQTGDTAGRHGKYYWDQYLVHVPTGREYRIAGGQFIVRRSAFDIGADVTPPGDEAALLSIPSHTPSDEHSDLTLETSDPAALAWRKRPVTMAADLAALEALTKGLTVNMLGIALDTGTVYQLDSTDPNVWSEFSGGSRAITSGAAFEAGALLKFSAGKYVALGIADDPALMVAVAIESAAGADESVSAQFGVGTEVAMVSDGTAIIPVGASVCPSTTTAGRVKPGTSASVGVNVGAEVAATPGLSVTVL